MYKDNDIEHFINVCADVWALFGITKICIKFMSDCIRNGEADKIKSIYFLEGKREDESI